MSNDSLEASNRPKDQSGRVLGKKSLKVTDRRMFTADGELREQFQSVGEAAESPNEVVATTEAVTSTEAVSPSSQGSELLAAEPASAQLPAEADPRPEEVEEAAAPDTPGFYDLVRLLAEHASIYLTEASRASPDEASQNLELARLHIGLLSVLQTKTQGNLASTEAAMLEDAIYQLRAGYAGVRG